MTIGFWKSTDEFGYFNNWYHAEFDMDGMHFRNSEQAFMYLKAKLFQDEEIANKILANGNPRICKNLGRAVKNYDHDTFEKNRYAFMVKVCYEKFSQNLDLKEKLLATTEQVLVEASPKDKIWGIGLSVDDPDFADPNKWKGEDLLGKALMEVREKLR